MRKTVISNPIYNTLRNEEWDGNELHIPISKLKLKNNVKICQPKELLIKSPFYKMGCLIECRGLTMGMLDGKLIYRVRVGNILKKYSFS